jgi:DNA-directed RNA polymerase subunit RPC12/RpoP
MTPLGRYSLYCDHGFSVGYECVRCWQRRALDAEAALVALQATLAELRDKTNRTFICVWCGEEVDTGCTPQECQENPEKVGELIARCRAHDEQCMTNPLRQQVADLRKELAQWQNAAGAK